jgi:hypothetical protein
VAPAAAAPPVSAAEREARRRRALRGCLRTAAKRPVRLRKRARRLCLRRYGRTPGRVGALRARALGRTKIVLSFKAAGSDGRTDPAARSYLIRQIRRSGPRGRRAGRAEALCHGSCRFDLTRAGTTVSLTVTDLRPHTTYSYTVAARDNVSRRLGPRVAVRARTR